MKVGDLVTCADWTEFPGEIALVTGVWCSNATPVGCVVCAGKIDSCSGLQLSALISKVEHSLLAKDVKPV